MLALPYYQTAIQTHDRPLLPSLPTAAALSKERRGIPVNTRLTKTHMLHSHTDRSLNVKVPLRNDSLKKKKREEVRQTNRQNKG